MGGPRWASCSLSHLVVVVVVVWVALVRFAVGASGMRLSPLRSRRSIPLLVAGLAALSAVFRASVGWLVPAAVVVAAWRLRVLGAVAAVAVL